MYLKKLEIHGFKSFAKKTALEFDPGIISVVGPNGSGKSNIADALRWVFGEQSMKLLRGKKAQDVIFAGSDQKARLGAAAVEVYFDNTDRKIPIDYQEVVLARRVYRDGNSDYLVNGNQVRLLDIQELLAKSGFANASYCVIGQGMIDQLILGGPAAIKELVEEASGVKPYYLKRERTLRRLDHTEANLAQVQALVAEIEPRLRSLRRQTRKLEHRGEIEQQLALAQTAYFSQILGALDRQIADTGGKIEVFERQISHLRAEIENLSKDIEQQEKGAVGSSGQYQNLRSDLDKLHGQKNKIQEELAILRGKLQVQESGPSPDINWRAVREKFEHAFGRLESLFENFNPREADSVKGLFQEIKSMLGAGAARQTAAAAREDLHRQEKKLNRDLEALFAKIKDLETDLENYVRQEGEVKQQLFVKERLLRNKQETLVKTAASKNELAVERARREARREAAFAEAREALGSGFAAASSPKAGQSLEALQDTIRNLKKQLDVIGGVDDLTVQEHKETEARYQYLTTQSQDLEKAVKDLKTVIAELDEIIKKEFQNAYSQISEKFAEYFRILFGGGRATMTIVRERPVVEGGEGEERVEGLKPEITGIEIRATPPGKKLAGIAALSGGERALTSIALLCAILGTFPSPFVVLDEVDAALDEANSIRFGKILGTLAHKTQFITITHNRETMRQSHTLYGVTMGEDGVSKVLSLKLEQAAAYGSKN